jgi:5-formyltetrahydrofolate cyclo-ligase
MKEKEQIRDMITGRRQSLSQSWTGVHSAKAAINLFGMNEFHEAGSLACYVSTGEEILTGDIIAECWKSGKRVCVPAFERESGSYRLCWFDKGTDLEKGPLTIGQPANPSWVADAALDLMLVPGMAFDSRGGRVGHGGGHYDRLMTGNGYRRSFKVGLAYDFQVLPEVPLEDHDVLMDAVVTETRIMRQGGI